MDERVDISALIPQLLQALDCGVCLKQTYGTYFNNQQTRRTMANIPLPQDRLITHPIRDLDLQMLIIVAYNRKKYGQVSQFEGSLRGYPMINRYECRRDDLRFGRVDVA